MAGGLRCAQWYGINGGAEAASEVSTIVEDKTRRANDDATPENSRQFLDPPQRALFPRLARLSPATGCRHPGNVEFCANG